MRVRDVQCQDVQMLQKKQKQKQKANRHFRTFLTLAETRDCETHKTAKKRDCEIREIRQKFCETAMVLKDYSPPL